MPADLRAPATGFPLNESERTQRSVEPGACLHERFERKVERTPDAVALAWEDESLSYAQLNLRANRLAHRLRERGVTPDQGLPTPAPPARGASAGDCLERPTARACGMRDIGGRFALSTKNGIDPPFILGGLMRWRLE